MDSVFPFRIFRKRRTSLQKVVSDSFHSSDPRPHVALLRTAGWVSAGAGALALGLFIGRELRSRYKFNRRTPYDFYAHSGDSQDLEFGVGI